MTIGYPKDILKMWRSILILKEREMGTEKINAGSSVLEYDVMEKSWRGK